MFTTMYLVDLELIIAACHQSHFCRIMFQMQIKAIINNIIPEHKEMIFPRFYALRIFALFLSLTLHFQAYALKVFDADIHKTLIVKH